MEMLYSKAGFWVINVAIIILSVIIVASQATDLSYLLHYFFQIPIWSGTFCGMVGLALCLACGGTRAVALIDVFQFVVLIVIIPLFCAYAYRVLMDIML